MTIADTDKRPDYDFELTDGSNTISFIFTDSNGERNPRAINQYPIQRMAIKNQIGSTKWSDSEFPYGNLEQDDWSGGEGSYYFDEDKSKYWIGYNVDTSSEGKVYPSPLPKHYVYNGTTQIFGERFVSDKYQNLVTAGEKLYHHKVPVAAGTIVAACLSISGYASAPNLDWIEVGVDMDMVEVDDSSVQDLPDEGIHIDICNDDGSASPLPGEPNLASVIFHDTLYPGQMNTRPAMIAGDGTALPWHAVDTKYVWVVLWFQTAGNIWVWDNGTADTYQENIKSTDDGATWTDFTAGDKSWISCRLISWPNNLLPVLPFTYKGVQYMVKRYTGGATAAEIWMNGSRGIAKTNSTTSIQISGTDNSDTSCAITTADADRTPVIVFPDLATEYGGRNYSRITGSNSTTFTFDAMSKAPDANTPYYVSGSPSWQKVHTLSKDVSGVAVAGEWVYFATNNYAGGKLIRYREFQDYSSGAYQWTRESVTDDKPSLVSNHIVSVNRSDGQKVYVGNRLGTAWDGSWVVSKWDVPNAWGDVYMKHSDPGWLDGLWNDYGQNYITPTEDWRGGQYFGISSSWSAAGPIATLDIEPFDMTNFAMHMEIMSASAISADVVQIHLSDFPKGGNITNGILPTAFWEWTLATNTFVDLTTARDSTGGTVQSVSPTTGTYYLVGCDYTFDTLIWTFGTANNVVGDTTPYIWSGGSWVAMTYRTEGTKTASKAWGQSGSDILEMDVATKGTYRLGTLDTWQKQTINGVEAYYMLLIPSTSFTAPMTISLLRLNKTINWVWNFNEAITSAYLNHYVSCTMDEDKALHHPYCFDTRNIIAVTLYYNSGTEPSNLFVRELSLTEINEEKRYFRLPKHQEITNMGKYSADASGIEKVWVFTNTSVWELDEEDRWNEMPLGELAQLSDVRTGRAWCQNDVYMVFNVSDHIERYYNRNLDDIGPESFPYQHTGNVVGLLSEPGAIYAVFDGWDYSNNERGISSIKMYKNSGWHTVYKPPDIISTSAYGEGSLPTVKTTRILSAFIQPLTGKNIFRMWVLTETDLLFLDFERGPKRSPANNATSECMLITGIMRTDLVDVNKIFSSVKLSQFAPSTDEQDTWRYQIYYRTTDQIGSSPTYSVWTEVTDDFPGATYSEEYDIASSPVRAKWIQFMLRGHVDGVKQFIDAISVEYVSIVPGKSAYSFNTSLLEGYLQTTLNEQLVLPGNFNADVATVYSQLQSWADNGTVLTQRCRNSMYHNKKVFLSYPASSPIENDSELSMEKILINLTTQEI